MVLLSFAKLSGLLGPPKCRGLLIIPILLRRPIDCYPFMLATQSILEKDSLLNRMDHFLASKYAIAAVVGVVSLCFFLLSKLALPLHPHEPPLLKPRIPFIGHVIGLVFGKIEYIGNLG